MSSDLEAVVEFFGADSIGLARSCGEPLRENDRWKMPEKNATDRGIKHKNELLRSNDIFGLSRAKFCKRFAAAAMVELVDTRDLKSLGSEGLCGFESRSRHIQTYYLLCVN